MDGISGYMLLALGLSASLGLICALSHPSFSKETEMAVGVLCLFAMASPVLSLVGNPSVIPELPDGSYAEHFGGITEIGEGAWLEGVASYLSDEYSVSAEDITVYAENFDFYTMRADYIRVSLSGAGVFANLHAMRDDILRSFVAEGGGCEVVMNFG
ncbi:MAG: hypothetical protein IKC87_03380 [Clostridia bacterium]|nr:hypothetical protein [Clostridia bacterium]